MRARSVTGVLMVTREELARIASRYDTAMAIAMLAALGHTAARPRHGPPPRPAACPGLARAAEALRLRGVRAAFLNRPDPVAWRRRERA